MSGTLETRLQYDSYFERESYLEQWVDLDYRNRDGCRRTAGGGRKRARSGPDQPTSPICL